MSTEHGARWRVANLHPTDVAALKSRMSDRTSARFSHGGALGISDAWRVRDQ